MACLACMLEYKHVIAITLYCSRSYHGCHWLGHPSFKHQYLCIRVLLVLKIIRSLIFRASQLLYT